MSVVIPFFRHKLWSVIDNGVDCDQYQHIDDSPNSYVSFNTIIDPIHSIYFDWVNRG